eukprot:CAMPEP_0172509484 /NCGR_PEP_ID=MMETSP1066-20121228/220655_1 /TAXON_ID=671091 /ORGANISM="Coscinodiscus wailesii, Strain CCMP2513" /LENGTH=135 /DNA_ID=CAMNT_0013287981 /DNA_START=377 /DNA_END=784 /DNA_ORIENTATION=+
MTTILQSSPDDDAVLEEKHLPKVEINYCTGCRWMFRAAWLAQELLTTFEGDLHSVALVPSRPECRGGVFIVTIDGETVWDRKEEGRHAEAKELKQRIRDMINPDRDLGHSESKDRIAEDLSDEEANEQRKFFGVA